MPHHPLCDLVEKASVLPMGKQKPSPPIVSFFCLSISLGVSLTVHTPHDVFLSGLDNHLGTCILEPKGPKGKRVETGYWGCYGDLACQTFQKWMAGK